MTRTKYCHEICHEISENMLRPIKKIKILPENSFSEVSFSTKVCTLNLPRNSVSRLTGSTMTLIVLTEP